MIVAMALWIIGSMMAVSSGVVLVAAVVNYARESKRERRKR